MSTTWTNDSKLVNVPFTNYDNPALNYDDPIFNYQGQQTTVWTNDSKS